MSNHTQKTYAERRTTSIRPKALARIYHVLPYLQGQERAVTDFISHATDQRVRSLVKKHKIILPPECAFDVSE